METVERKPEWQYNQGQTQHDNLQSHIHQKQETSMYYRLPTRNHSRQSKQQEFA